MKQSYYRETGRRAVGSGYPWREDDQALAESSLCEVIPFPQGADDSGAIWRFSKSDAIFAVALTGFVTALICLAPAILSLFA